MQVFSIFIIKENKHVDGIFFGKHLNSKSEDFETVALTASYCHTLLIRQLEICETI